MIVKIKYFLLTDEQDENDEYNMSSDSDSDDDGNDDDDNDNDDNDNDDNDNDDSDKDPVTASTSAALLEESAESDANMTMSFLSVPEEMQVLKIIFDLPKNCHYVGHGYLYSFL